MGCTGNGGCFPSRSECYKTSWLIDVKLSDEWECCRRAHQFERRRICDVTCLDTEAIVRELWSEHPELVPYNKDLSDCCEDGIRASKQKFVG